MDPTVRKGQRCPVCKKGAIVQRNDEATGRYLGCSTFNPARPTDPGSDRTRWRMDGSIIYPKTNSRTLIFGLILSLVLIVVIFLVLTKIFA